MTRYYVEKENIQVIERKAGIEVSFNLSGTPDDWFSVTLPPHDAMDLSERIKRAFKDFGGDQPEPKIIPIKRKE